MRVQMWVKATAFAALVVGVLGAAVAGCRAEPVKRVGSGNASVAVELLTSFDDVRLYRVQDGSAQTVYVAVQGGGAAQATWFTGKHEDQVHQALTTAARPQR